MDTIVKVKRINMRGGPSKIVISTDDGKEITIQPNDEAVLKLVRLLSGGPQETIVLPGESK